MRYLVRLVNGGDSAPADAKALASSAFESVRGYGADIGNLRVSRTAIELDLLLPSKESLGPATRALEEKFGAILNLRELDTPPPSIGVDQAIREGIGLFNEERYWESHEALEYAWRRAEGSEKEMLQGVILVAAALVHLQKNQREVALSVMARANAKLAPHQGVHFGVRIDSVCETLAGMIAEGRPDFFRIEAGPYNSAAAT